jgi:uncharacterized protein YwgA
MASNSKSGGKTVAIGKRAKIDSAQRYMLIFVGVASVLLGITVVAVIYFAKTISFNAKLISAKDEIISAYKNTQKNLDQISNKISGLSTNDYLESVGRMRDINVCADYDGQGMDSKYSLKSLPNVRKCSALRVITDALPYTKNPDSALTSFYILLLLADNKGAQVDNISATEFESTDINGEKLSTLRISADFRDTTSKVLRSITSIERSIRNFNVTKATLTYGNSEDSANSNLSLSTSYVVYSADKAGLVNVKKTVCAKATNEKCTKAGNEIEVSSK